MTAKPLLSPLELFVGIALLLALPACSLAVVTFERTYGGVHYDGGAYVQQTVDGGYIVGGVTTSYGAGSYDFYLVKTDSLGAVLWSRTYGDDNLDACSYVQQTADGGYVLAGYSWSWGSGWDFYLVRTDSCGDAVWAKRHGRSADDICKFAEQTSDGGYVMVGSTLPYRPDTLADVYLVRTDPFGNILWTRMYGGTEIDCGNCIRQTLDGGYVICGFSDLQEHVRGMYIVRTDSVGDTLWTRRYAQTCWDWANYVVETADGQFVVTGVVGGNICLLKMDRLGDIIWAKVYGSDGADIGRCVQQTLRGGYVVTGSIETDSPGHPNLYLMETDSLGNSMWIRRYGGAQTEGGNCVRQTWDRGYVVCGSTESFGAGDLDIYLLKTDRNGLIGACQPVEPPEMRTQGYWRRQCKDDSQEDVCAYVDSVRILADLFDAFDCDSTCALMNVNPPENDMCRKAKRQFMALLLNTASGKISVCNCLEDGREVGDVIAEIDSLLSNNPDFHTCVHAKTLADDINNGMGIVPCDTAWIEAAPRTVPQPSISAIPNPFARRTVINYELGTSGAVRLEVYDRAGRLLRTLVDGTQPPGSHSAEWDGLNGRGTHVSAGIYFCRLRIEDGTTTGKLISVW